MKRSLNFIFLSGWLDIDQDERFRALHYEPRFVALVERVREDNARLLRAVLSGEVSLAD